MASRRMQVEAMIFFEAISAAAGKTRRDHRRDRREGGQARDPHRRIRMAILA
jgi:hypothetical protein